MYLYARLVSVTCRQGAEGAGNERYFGQLLNAFSTRSCSAPAVCSVTVPFTLTLLRMDGSRASVPRMLPGATSAGS